MPSKFFVSDNHFEKIGTVLSVGHGFDGEVHFHRNVVIKCQKAIEQRDPPAFAEAFGLPPDTPPDLIVEAVNALRLNPDNPVATLETMGIWEFIKRSAEVISVVQSLVGFAMGAAKLVGWP